MTYNITISATNEELQSFKEWLGLGISEIENHFPDQGGEAIARAIHKRLDQLDRHAE